LLVTFPNRNVETNLPCASLPPIVDNNQLIIIPEVVPTVVPIDNNNTINKEHYQVDNILHQFKAHIPAETDNLDKWSEFVQTDNSIYHRDPDINNL
jgi:hypothetical protein